MKRRFAILFTALVSAQAFAAPAEVFVIRHAEKQKHSPDLSEAGYQRAQELASLFGPRSSLLRHGPLCAIYAAAPAKPGGSMRPIETVTPLAQASQLSVQTNYTKNDLQQMVSAIMASHECDGRSVLIAWIHQDIPLIAETFGVQNAPSTWSGSDYDDVWDISLASPSSPTMTIFPQNL